MTDILLAASVIGGSGLILGIVLAVFSKVMAVPIDKKQEEVREMLPGANCGACGHTSCDGYAKALSGGTEEDITLCKPGGASLVEGLANYLGLEASAVEETTAMVFCQGNNQNTSKSANYTGPPSCKMAKLVAGGDSDCSYGCLGYGDCVDVCEYDAIHMVDGVAIVDPAKCTSCMMCINICPQRIIKLSSLAKAHSIVFCLNEDRAPAANKACKASCISCRLCVKVCPEQCITIENNRAVIDYKKCTNCGECQIVCPHKCILSLYPPANVAQ